MKAFAPQIEAPVKAGTVQRKCGCAAGSTCSCNDHEKESPGAGVVQRRARAGAATAPAAASKSAHATGPVSGAAAGPAVSPSVTRGIQQASGGGHSLPASVRSPMEAGLGGRDLSHVRVHTDGNAHHLADSLHAQAFTTGSNIFFAQNQYRPESQDGQRLLAHELTHVVQQGGTSTAAIQPRLELGAVDTAAEREADRVADAIVGGSAASPIVAAPRSVVHRAAKSRATASVPAGPKPIVLPRTQPLLLPEQKAESAADFKYLLDLYQTAARNRRLRTTHAGRASGLWTNWAAGRQNVPNVRDYYNRLRSVCSPDHIQELQVGGDDNSGNLRLLSQARNEEAGSQIAGQIRSLETTYGIGSDGWLEFSAVAPKPGTSATKDPQCLTGEEPLKRPGGATTIAAGLHECAFVAGESRRRVGFEPGGDVPSKHQYAIPGAKMEKIVPQTDGTHLIHARISPKIHKLPVDPKQAPFDFKTDGPQPTGTGAWPNLKLANPGPLSLIFPKMSPATLTPRIEDGEWRATGELTPTLPVLNKTKVHLEVADGQLSGGVKVDASALKSALPIPGLTIHPVALDITLTNGDFSATGGFDFKYGSLAQGSLTAS
ncbi:MAG TPA: DUF4157 domain-containing protein, partial [Gemmatimonadaceae bacterium]|nr:DUF4157 domain-containing protein [Gemmatimonadaceae bacterium]